MEQKTDVIVNDNLDLPIGQTESPVKIVITKGKITVDGVEKSKFQKDKTLTATLRQVITRQFTYPETRIDNNLSDSLADLNEFKFENKTITTHETRVTFVNVPDTWKKETAEAMLLKYPNATLYRILKNKPVLSDMQELAIESGITTLETIANSQVVRYGENVVVDGTDVSGQVILDKNGKLQYRSIYFKKEETADIDERNADKTDMFVTPELKAEVFGAVNEHAQHIS